MRMMRYKLLRVHRNILFISQERKKKATVFLDLFLGSLNEAPSCVNVCDGWPGSAPSLQSHCWRARMTPGCVTFGFGVDSRRSVFELTTSHRVGLFVPDYQKAVLRHADSIIWDSTQSRLELRVGNARFKNVNNTDCALTGPIKVKRWTLLNTWST